MASLDISLDDMIKNSRNSRRGRGQGRARHGRGAGGSFSGGRMTGPPRRGPLRVNTQQSPYAIAKSFRRPKSFPWQRDLLEDSLRSAGLPGVENGTKLYISNLDTGVTNEDIRELFSEFGQLKRHAVHYDKNGRPNGSAAVVFTRRSDAFQALKRYNNVQLDGKPMKIEIIGTNSEIPASARVNVVRGVNGRTVAMPGGRSRGSATVSRGSGQRGRGGGFRNSRGHTRGRGRGGRGGRKPMDKSADDLDKELENYHAGAMET